jgi:hypothetical protein
MKSSRFALALAISLVPGLLLAAPAATTKIKPGLWESSTSVGGADSRVQQAMAMLQNLPPEQRKMMEGMMAKQGVTLGAGGEVQAKACITREMADAGQMPMRQQGSCTQQISPMVGNTVQFSFRCTNPQASGQGSVTFSSDSAYAGAMSINSSATGAPETVNVQTAGHWAASDCGAIKPMVLPKSGS